MQIDSMTVKNFRCFAQADWMFAPQVNLLVGDNGSGKTAMLDAMRFGLSVFVRYLINVDPDVINMPGENRAGVPFQQRSDARIIAYRNGNVPTREPQYPVEVEQWGQIARQRQTWGWTGESDANFRLTNLKAIAAPLREAVQNGHDIELPLIACYGCGRLCSTTSSFPTNSDHFGPGSRLDGYNACLDPTISQRALLNWFRRLEYAALQRNETFAVLEGVRAAIIACVEDAAAITFDILEDELVLRFKDRRELPLRMLSDGYRNILSLVADIAYRAAILNPHYGEQAPQRTPGVVLIDEIDLHLHPTWQRVVIGNLIKAFPHLQFFMTTHAPLIIQSLEVSSEAKLINLDPGLSAEYRHKSPEEIYEENQGVEHIERSHRFRQMVEAAANYYRALEEAETASSERLEQLKRRMDELMLPFSDEPAYVAFVEMHREANHATARSKDAAR
jgi:predicted ATP-binding protein involved in virulence